MAEQCNMIVGFLIPHRCEHPALGHCTQCGRIFCEEHISIKPKGMVCLACSQGLPDAVSLPITQATFTPSDIAIFSAASTWEDTDRDTFSDLS